MAVHHPHSASRTRTSVGVPRGSPTRTSHLSTNVPRPPTRRRRLAPVLGLFLLAPFVGEYLLGNLSFAELPLGLLLAPLYGCGALLVREIGRRSGGGWPTMVLLAAAYALIEEGPVDQLLWNASYAGTDLLHGPSFIASLGMSVELTQSVIALHTVWSICVPIALIEALVPRRSTEPWLRRGGLTLTAIIYLLGATLVFYGNYTEEHFIASPAQLGGIAVVIAVLIATAFWIRARRLPRLDARAPSPRRVGVAALLTTSLYGGLATAITADWYEWIGVGLWTVLAAASVALVSRWSRSRGWGPAHVFALAAGATTTYAWLAFPTRPEAGGPLATDLAGNAVFATVAVAILVLAGRQVTRHGAAELSTRWSHDR